MPSFSLWEFYIFQLCRHRGEHCDLMSGYWVWLLSKFIFNESLIIAMCKGEWWGKKRKETEETGGEYMHSSMSAGSGKNSWESVPSFQDENRPQVDRALLWVYLPSVPLLQHYNPTVSLPIELYLLQGHLLKRTLLSSLDILAILLNINWLWMWGVIFRLCFPPWINISILNSLKQHLDTV